MTGGCIRAVYSGSVSDVSNGGESTELADVVLQTCTEGISALIGGGSLLSSIASSNRMDYRISAFSSCITTLRGLFIVRGVDT